MPNQDLPISGLPPATLLDGTELFVVVQDGVTKYIPATYVNYVTSNNYGLFNQTGASTPITNTTTETSLLDGGVGTMTVPANGFKVGDGFHAVLSGFISSVNNHTLRIRVKTDDTILADTGVMTLSGTTNRHWRMEINFSINALGGAGTAEIATSGIFSYRKDASLSMEGEIFSLIENTNFNTTIENTLYITAQWGTASTSDTIYSQIFTLSKSY